MLLKSSLAPGRERAYLKYALVGQRLVEGWLLDPGLILIDTIDRLQREQGVAGHVAEIGVHHGRLFILLSMLRRDDENAVALDLFEDQHLNVDKSGEGDRGRFTANLRRWDPRWQDVRIETANSWDIDGAKLRGLAGGLLRLVSVDGGHTADLTFHDLTTAVDSLTPGGVVVLDDCFNEIFPAVAQGAQEFFRQRTDVTAFVAAGNKTLISQIEYADAYREAIAEKPRSRPFRCQTHDFLGRPLFTMQPLEGKYAREYWRRYVRGWIYHRLGRA